MITAKISAIIFFMFFLPFHSSAQRNLTGILYHFLRINVNVKSAKNSRKICTFSVNNAQLYLGQALSPFLYDFLPEISTLYEYLCIPEGSRHFCCENPAENSGRESCISELPSMGHAYPFSFSQSASLKPVSTRPSFTTMGRFTSIPSLASRRSCSSWVMAGSFSFKFMDL